ncbi:albusnodin family lasso peptide [Actinorugispora endophytica]|uniref:Albusnodin family lasso peptide n=1 Tax=Actinorugispora endophytica TaxID=1605990 RepID=A0A4R6UJ01_9ACTN|nr:albusnodin family lasso peptide [Actinorugispora endophytica]TDQ45389.1 hypothetical protein EV190_13211 [Actinorugispora endophytica]
MSEPPQQDQDVDALLVDVGDAAEMTEGVGKAKSEAKRQPYN